MHGDRFDHQCVPRYGLESDGTSFRIDKLQRNGDRVIGIRNLRPEDYAGFRVLDFFESLVGRTH